MAIKAANDKSMSNITALPSGVSAKSLILLSTTTASSSGTVDITSGIDSTYKEYQIHLIDVHPETDNTDLKFQFDTGTNTNYNQTITSTLFLAHADEADSNTGLNYYDSKDLAQSTSFQFWNWYHGADNDQSTAGILHLYDPSNTTFVKHFLVTGNVSRQNDYTASPFVAGYINTTTAITRVQFKMSSGDIDAGTFKLYGVV